MTEDTQCETMGLQATMLTNPLERYIPPSPSLKRKTTEEILPTGGVGLVVDPPKKLCLEVLKDASSRVVEEALQTILDEDNKENQSRTKVHLSPMMASNGGSAASDVPKVIVQHSPLPSIYELEQMAALPATAAHHPNPLGPTLLHNSTTSSSCSSSSSSSSNSEEEEEETIPTPPLSDDSGSDESEEDDFTSATAASPAATRTYPQTLEQRYWGAGGGSALKRSPPASVPLQSHPSPPPSPFGFLEQNDQRIECAENGKSYLQLGTVNHHHHHHHHHHGSSSPHHNHIPVTPVIQPKSPYYHQHHHHQNQNNHHSSPARRAQLRHHHHHMLPRPLCDHSNCLQRRSSLCYRNHRNRMLNVSLHKLHLARQNHEGSLRRSVLICNMLRHIEEEAEKEQIEQAHFNNNHLPPSSSGISNGSEELYSWSTSGSNDAPSYNGNGVGVPPSPLPPQATQLQVLQPQPQQPQQQTPFPGQTSPPYDTYEMTLKDFNSAFRSTPYGSPAHHLGSIDGDSMLEESGVGETAAINWSSVLNLSSGSALDPLNNNSSFGATQGSMDGSSNNGNGGHSWGTTNGNPNSNPTSPIPTNNSTQPNHNNNNIVISNSKCNITADEGFEELGWKLSAEDVLKAFPNDEHIFVGP
ncbi:uncharacterized protein [Lepeophtheirus salmonis]|uniref:SERTA domain-containing protein n=1 Tax=Lepeophtheirus salmonis TaxID=72036 RepID=A0A0K2UZG8_LEPSM|nr:transcriptional regulator GZF3-like isoform X1 [Lepeophtheirus salmonis]